MTKIGFQRKKICVAFMAQIVAQYPILIWDRLTRYL